MQEGWILLHRKLQECEIWANSQPFDMRSAWVDLLLLANHKDAEIIFDYKPMTVKRGQYLTSVRKLSARWSWSKDRTLKYLRLLESLGMIHRDSTNQRTLITIDNYSVYQDKQDTSTDTEQTRLRTQDGHETDTGKDTGSPQTKNENNDNNDKEKYICAFDEFWKNYPRKKDKARAYKCYCARLNDGYTEDQLLTACINYAAECEHNKTEERYIKHGATFLSVNEPFLDYLKGENNDVAGRTRDDEEQRNAEIDRYLESDEYRNGEDDMPFVPRNGVGVY